MEVYVSAFSFCRTSLEDILEQCRLHDISNIELGAGIAYDPGMLDSVKRANDLGFNFLVHNYFPTPKDEFVLNLASDDAVVSEQSRQHCKRAIELCSRLGCPFYSVHSGFAIELKAEHLGKSELQSQLPKELYIPYSTAYKNFVDSLLEINEYAKAKGVGILIENNVITLLQVKAGQKDAFLMTSTDEINSLMQQIDDENIGLLVDVGHLNVSANACGFDRKDFIRNISPHIRAFHLSENDGHTDQHLSLRKDSWFLPLLRDFPEAAFVIESHGSTIAYVKSQVQLVEQVFEFSHKVI
ncbi:MAG TPA: sugar phosphate isomerase/epimerase [Phycisphaerales bacterium]|nr:sugar phosphate isomerase/epimerase [Phycisphaerales bacterium]